MNNISKLFYKDYYSKVDFSYVLKEQDTAKTNNELVPSEEINKINNTILKARLYKIPANPLVNSVISDMKVAYPGLVTGVGLVHDSKKLDGAFNLGIHLDYTFGMPIVYGSSVKGVLHSFFREFYNGNMDAVDLCKDIFEGKNRDFAEEKKKYGNWADTVEKRIYRNKSIYKRDIFFDAVVVSPDAKDRILTTDSITPHGDDPLKNPTPIAFLKIASGCGLEFRFRLVDSVIGNKTLSKNEKKELFLSILKTVGIGAKTNVGYGQFE